MLALNLKKNADIECEPWFWQNHPILKVQYYANFKVHIFTWVSRKCLNALTLEPNTTFNPARDIHLLSKFSLLASLSPALALAVTKFWLITCFS